MADRFSCAVRSREIGEPLHGTASQISRWLLVEQPGPWGADAVLQSRLPVEIGMQLRARARSVGARLLLIRRHGRANPTHRVAYVVASTAATRRVERVRFDDPAALLDLDLEPLRRLEPVGGEPIEEPLYLVCTNGSHDACCAQWGRPVAKVLATALADAVWESSHFGGDRFAGNLVCLPDGIYYGRVEVDDALHLVREHQAGRLVLAHLRGRSSLSFPAQAAEQLVRLERGFTGLDDVGVQRVERLADGSVRVELRTPEGPAAAEVECTEALDPQQLTCRSGSEEHPPRYALRSLVWGDRQGLGHEGG